MKKFAVALVINKTFKIEANTVEEAQEQAFVIAKNCLQGYSAACIDDAIGIGEIIEPKLNVELTSQIQKGIIKNIRKGKTKVRIKEV